MPRRSRNVHTPTACLIVVTLVFLTGLSAHPQEPPCEPGFTMSLTGSKDLKWTVLDDEARRELLDLLYKEAPLLAKEFRSCGELAPIVEVPAPFLRSGRLYAGCLCPDMEWYYFGAIDDSAYALYGSSTRRQNFYALTGLRLDQAENRLLLAVFDVTASQAPPRSFVPIQDPGNPGGEQARIMRRWKGFFSEDRMELVKRNLDRVTPPWLCSEDSWSGGFFATVPSGLRRIDFSISKGGGVSFAVTEVASTDELHGR